MLWDDGCQAAGELRTFSRSRGWHWDGRWAGKQEQQMGRPISSCPVSSGQLPLSGPLSGPGFSPESTEWTYFHFWGVVVLMALKLAHMKLRIPSRQGSTLRGSVTSAAGMKRRQNISVCYIFWRITGLRSCNERVKPVSPQCGQMLGSVAPVTPPHLCTTVFNLYVYLQVSWKATTLNSFSLN